MAKFSTVLKARLLLFKDDRILLLHQTKKNGGNHTLVGGTIENREYAMASLIRESLEEAGILLEKQNLRLVHVLHKRTKNGHRMTLYFRAENWNGTPHSREQTKFKNVEWHPLADLPDTLTDTVKHVLIQVQQGKIYSEYTKKE